MGDRHHGATALNAGPAFRTCVREAIRLFRPRYHRYADLPVYRRGRFWCATEGQRAPAVRLELRLSVWRPVLGRDAVRVHALPVARLSVGDAHVLSACVPA